MAKLVVKFDNDVLDHVEIKQGDMKIGRKPGCDIHLDNLAVSGEHANIFTIGEDSFVQDMGSTNGTFINNKRITKHHLRNGDTVVIGKYSLVFLSEAATKVKEDFAKTVIINPGMSPGLVPPMPAAASMAPAAPAAAAAARLADQQAALFILSGANSGKRIEVTKTVTNLGKTGKRAGTISRTADGYILAPVDEGEESPKLNGRAITSSGAKLKNGDVIEVSGTRLQFYLK
jgi:pSer/pThr/pTyr-binding forkhead associated (FHA) protein